MPYRKETVADIPGCFDALGGLHDVRVDRISVGSPKQRTVDIHVIDLNANCSDLEQHVMRPCVLRFFEVVEVIVDVNFREGIRIGDTEVFADSSLWRLHFDLNLGGGARTAGKGSISLLFGHLEILDI